VDAAGSFAGDIIGCVRIIRIDVPTESKTQIKASSSDFHLRFMAGGTYAKALYSMY
jgi:hypothetical protein